MTTERQIPGNGEAAIRSDWQTYWKDFDAGTTPTSMSLHPDFIALVQPNHAIIDVGCCAGRATRELAEKTGSRVVGIDINDKELALASQHHVGDGRRQRVNYFNASGAEMPFSNQRFHGAILLGVLGGVQGDLRASILQDTVRVLKPGSPLYVSEFERIQGSPRWDEEYAQNARVTGEMGSVLVYQKGTTDQIRFIGYHFEQSQLGQMLQEQGLVNIQARRVNVSSTVKEHMYQNLCMWGFKK